MGSCNTCLFNLLPKAGRIEKYSKSINDSIIKLHLSSISYTSPYLRIIHSFILIATYLKTGLLSFPAANDSILFSLNKFKMFLHYYIYAK